MPDDVAAITRRDVEAFQADLLARLQPSTVYNRHRALKSFFRWLVTEELLERSPMEGMRPPTVPERPVAVLEESELRALIRACEGKRFADRRDMAIVRLLIDTGMRRAECAGLQLEDLDLDLRVAFVLGKGRRPRSCPFGHKTTQALDRYLRVRASHPLAYLPNLWLGKNGPTGDSGIAQVVRLRGVKAGIPGLRPHQLRHTFASRWLAEGGAEGDLMRLAGWRDRGMLGRYGAVTAEGRARDAHHRMGLGDRL